MARIDDEAAAAFPASRELPPDALSEWRAAIARHLAPRPGMRFPVLEAVTGRWAAALASWSGISIVAAGPSPAMCACIPAGEASALPLTAATMDGAWLSTVAHHMPDRLAAARELRRVLRPAAPSASATHAQGATTVSGRSATGPRPPRSWIPFPASDRVRSDSPQLASATRPRNQSAAPPGHGCRVGRATLCGAVARAAGIRPGSASPPMSPATAHPGRWQPRAAALSCRWAAYEPASPCWNSTVSMTALLQSSTAVAA